MTEIKDRDDQSSDHEDGAMWRQVHELLTRLGVASGIGSGLVGGASEGDTATSGEHDWQRDIMAMHQAR
jgi:hypothetical protein